MFASSWEVSLRDVPLTALLIEDDDVDAEAVVRGFRSCGVGADIVRVTDGVEALAVLRRGLPQPFVILLDLNTPRMNGFEFLDELRRDPALRDAEVFVLTTSGAAHDRTAARERNVAGYFVKSEAGRDFRDLVSRLVPDPAGVDR